MSSESTEPYNNNLKAIVDIGSNGIRFSISSTEPNHARIFPCLYKDRAAISLFDAQHQNTSSEGVGNEDKKHKKKKDKEKGKGKDKKTKHTESGKSTITSSPVNQSFLSLQTLGNQSNVLDKAAETESSFLSSLKKDLTRNTDMEDADIEVEVDDIDPDESMSAITPVVTKQQPSQELNDTSQNPSANPALEAAEAAARAAAGDKNDIPKEVIHDVVYALLRFKVVCDDFRVPIENIKVVATEATREAPNSEEFRDAIYQATGWKVSLLSKSEEARSGAYGVASSFNAIHGLFMDLGGGSTQLSWISCINGDFNMSDSPVSLPYGAAALTRRLTKGSAASPSSSATGEETGPVDSTEDLYEEIKVRLQDAVKTIQIPQEMQDNANLTGGFKLYVSGGGFRGLGNLLLSRGETVHEQTTTFSTRGTNTPNTIIDESHGNGSTTKNKGSESLSYPIPIINGYACTCEPLKKLVEELNPLSMSAASMLTATSLQNHNNSSLSLSEESGLSTILQRQMVITGGKKKLFRVSERRAHQLPAVMLLVRAILESLPPIRKVLFSQGGVREGVLFHDLPRELRMQDPLFVATRELQPKSADRYHELLVQTLPPFIETVTSPSQFLVPDVIRDRLLRAIANTAFVHSSYPKELQPLAALNIAITGAIADTHGLSHEVRVLLGLALSQRWGGEIPDKGLRDSMISILAIRKLAWWALYCGHLMHVIGGVYPGGTVRDKETEEKVFSIRTEFLEHGIEEPLTTDYDEEDRVFSGALSGSNHNKMKHGGSSSIIILKGGKKYKQHFVVKIRASGTSPKTAAPMVRSRINNLEKKLKKLSKDFGPAYSCRVHVEVDWF